MAEAQKRIERPLSPHLQIYRWPLTMLLSILHRMSGVGAGLGTLLLTWWLIATVTGPEAYEQVQVCMGSILGRLILFGFSLSLIFHTLNGVRHLVWDVGRGFEIRNATLSGWLVVVLTFILTALAWTYGLRMWGGEL